MSEPNPYRAPNEVAPRLPDLPPRKASFVGMDFESDWSPEGLRLRRRSEWQGLIDLGFALLTVAWIVSFVSASFGSPNGGLFCFLTPVWIVSGVLWFYYLVFRSGGSFAKKYPGLAGAVKGRIENGIVRIDGPALQVVARLRDCPRCSLYPKRSSIQPPGFESSLPIVGNDIKRMWRSEEAVDMKSDSATLLAILEGDEPTVTASGQLLGSDLRGQNLWWIWLSLGAVSTAIAIALAAWSVYRFLNLPPWILNPPPHYQWNNVDSRTFLFPCLAALLSLLAAGIGLWYLWRLFRPLGRFAVLVTPTAIAIANKFVAFGYHGTALGHFTWTNRGMVVRDSTRKVLFLIPARWLSDEDRALITGWHDARATSSAIGYYAGPKV